MSRLFYSFLMGLLLSACTSEEHGELQQWMRDVTKDMRGRVEPLPVVKPYEPYAYSAASLPDPFSPARLDPVAAAAKSGGGIRPDADRKKEPLELFPLESLTMVGNLQQGNINYGLVKADKGVYRVRAGNHLGQNFGLITKISESEISVKELIQDPSGNWGERMSALQLQETETRK